MRARALAAVEQVSVMGDGSVYTDTLYVNGSKTEKNPKYIRKAYLRFDGGAYQPYAESNALSQCGRGKRTDN